MQAHGTDRGGVKMRTMRQMRRDLNGGGDDEKLRMNKPRQMKERTGESAAAEPVVDSAAEIWKRGSRCIITRERNLLSSIYVLG